MKTLFIILIILNLSIIKSGDCDSWDSQYFCGEEGTDGHDFLEELDANAFQTPPRNDIYGRYMETFQDMHYLVGYARTEYSADRKSATVTFVTKVNPILGTKDIDYKIIYVFDQEESNVNHITINSEGHSYPKGMPISAKIKDLKTNKEIVKLELENKFFIWDNIEISRPEQYKNGQRGAIVELFGWPYEDITEECEFLGHAGYLGVKIYTPNEQILSDEMVEGAQINPWWYGTQIVSFKLHSRGGDINQLKKLINTCRSYNVSVYAEVVVNHMTGCGFDMYDNHRQDGGDGGCTYWGRRTGSAGSPFWGVGGMYENNPVTGKKPVLEYTSVPYFPSDFHCRIEITNWKDPEQLTKGWLATLADVNTEKEYPRQRIADFLTELISIGISGISIANGRHIIPESFVNIFKKLKENLGGNFPEDLILVIILENIEMDMAMCDEDSGLNFGKPFNELLTQEGFTNDEIYQIKIWLKGFAIGEFPICEIEEEIGDEEYDYYEEWAIDQNRHAISIEYSDDINKGNDYPIYIRDQNINDHREITISMFENEELGEYSGKWEIIFIFSSFSLFNDTAGMLDGKSDCSYCSTDNCRQSCSDSIPYRKAYKPTSKGYDPGDGEENWIGGEFSRVHRDQLIIQAMKKWLYSYENGEEVMDEEQIYGDEIAKTNCQEKCLTCSEESKKDDLCLICNKDAGYFPVKDTDEDKEFYECYHKDNLYDRLYYDKKEMAFKPCYESCKTCSEAGTPEEHNCLSCDANLVKKPGSDSDTFNCVTNCANSYYFTSSGQYKCTDNVFCPTEASIYIKEKNKCIDSCKNDADYRYLYLGTCVDSCPENTIKDEENLLCKDKNNQGETNDCILSVKDTTIDEFHNYAFINSIVKTYRNEFSYNDKHILKYTYGGRSGYNLFIYKKQECIDKLSINIQTIDNEKCINFVKDLNSITEDLIIVHLQSTASGQEGYLLYNPITGNKLDLVEQCSNIINEDNFQYIRIINEESCPDGKYPVINRKSLTNLICKGEDEQVAKYYFAGDSFLPCYESCKTCSQSGDDNTNNCNSCDSDYIKDPHDYTTSQNFNCLKKCMYSYYYDDNDIYKCSSTPNCPLDFNKYIKERNECIEDCTKDNTYRYLYNGNCLKECPSGTNIDESKNDLLCREPNIDECRLSKKEAGLKNFYEDGGLDSLVKSYTDEFFYTRKHVSEFNNTEFKILIYRDESCLKELNVKFPTINFGGCYEKVKVTLVDGKIYNNISQVDDLTVVLLERYGKNGGSASSYSLYHPLTGQKLDAEEICKEDEIVVEENILSILEEHNLDYESLAFLTKQNIDIFDSESAFYTDICFPFDSPNNRDVTLEDRFKSFYPNISLCDEGCVSKGIDLTTMKAICNCKFNDISKNELIDEIKDIGPMGEIFEIISSSNIQVFKCFKYMFDKFSTSIGGYLIIFSLIGVIGLGLLFYLRDLNRIKKYIANKTTNYLNYISDANASPEDKKDAKDDIIKDDLSKNKILGDSKNESINKIKNANKQNNIDKGKDILSINKINNSKDALSHSFKDQNSKNEMIDVNEKKKEIKKDEEKKIEDDILDEKEKEDFKEYLKPDVDDQEFEDIVLNDKRTFQEYFCDSLADKQIFVNTFFNEDPFRPLSIKIILLILNMILYMVVNGIFYGEEAISEIYHIEGDDPFFGFFPRSLTRFVYSAIVGVVIGLIVDCFFIEERRMIRIFIREKENIVNLKFEITKLNKQIKMRYIGFIIFVIVLLILFLFYLLCFNYVYPHTQYEWIKSSITLIIIMQILSTLTSLAETTLRFIGLRFKSERIFRVSKLLD